MTYLIILATIAFCYFALKAITKSKDEDNTTNIQ